jgi:hypothetical protein
MKHPNPSLPVSTITFIFVAIFIFVLKSDLGVVHGGGTGA